MEAAQAQGDKISQGAGLALGQKMIAESTCVACHSRKLGGNSSKMDKPAGRINNADLLRSMVAMCSTPVSLGLFPKELTVVAAALNRDHHKFK